MLAAACHFDPIVAPYTEADCQGACQRRHELQCGRGQVDVALCVDRCVAIEKLRARVTKSPCVARSTSCPEIDACSKRSTETP